MYIIEKYKDKAHILRDKLNLLEYKWNCSYIYQ
jgi:hypothetical protein